MLNKTSLMFKEDVKQGYIHYQFFQQHWSMVIAAFKKYILTVPVNIGVDCNNDWLNIQLIYNQPTEEWIPQEWEELTTLLKEEGFPYTANKEDWSIIISIDNFVETILSKPELYRW